MLSVPQALIASSRRSSLPRSIFPRLSYTHIISHSLGLPTGAQGQVLAVFMHIESSRVFEVRCETILPPTRFIGVGLSAGSVSLDRLPGTVPGRELIVALAWMDFIFGSELFHWSKLRRMMEFPPSSSRILWRLYQWREVNQSPEVLFKVEVRHKPPALLLFLYGRSNTVDGL